MKMAELALFFVLQDTKQQSKLPDRTQIKTKNNKFVAFKKKFGSFKVKS